MLMLLTMWRATRADRDGGIFSEDTSHIRVQVGAADIHRVVSLEILLVGYCCGSAMLENMCLREE